MPVKELSGTNSGNGLVKSAKMSSGDQPKGNGVVITPELLGPNLDTLFFTKFFLKVWKQIPE